MAGKGDSPRPLSVSYETYGSNYDTIFGTEKKIPWYERPEHQQFVDQVAAEKAAAEQGLDVHTSAIAPTEKEEIPQPAAGGI